LLLKCSGRVFASLDHGATWTERSSPTYQAFGLQVAKDGSLYAAASDGIYRSTDRAASWSLAASPPSPCPTIVSLLLSEDENVLVVAVGLHPFYVGLVCGGIYRSEDAGQTWNLELDRRYVTGLTRDPETPTRIFASANYVFGAFEAEGDVFRSDDDGRTWTPLGMPTADAEMVATSADGRRI